MRRQGLHVEAARCVGCGACRVLCPELFAIESGKARVVRLPLAEERVFVDAARWLCPMDAVRSLALDEPFGPSAQEHAPTFDALARGAEGVRWALSDVPWADVVPERAPSSLRSVVREMALSESATYSATQRFLDACFDDLELSKWMSVWFYEETRHPHVLVQWLRRVGEPIDGDFELRGRVSTPFMRSMTGTLVSNVVSEVTATRAYGHLAATSPEPVLAALARHIACDEARHAATFFMFARQRLASSPPEMSRRDRARGVEVLQAWLGGAQATTHPVAQMLERLQETGEETDPLALEASGVRVRVVRVVGLLLGLPLRRVSDVGPVLMQLLKQRGES
jgi:ferredoxin